MRVKLILSILFVIGLLFIVSCTCKTVEEQGKPVVYIVEEPQIKTYVIEEKNPLTWYEQTKQQRYQQNLRRSIDEYEDEQEEFKFKSKLSNVRRIIDNELTVGYDKDFDNPRFEEVDS